MDKMDIVLQGPANDFTIEISKYYLELSIINKIIISCYDDCNIPDSIDDNIIVSRIPDVKWYGVGNVNRQIATSFNGLKLVSTERSAKMRSDQMVHKDDMEMMKIFMESNISCDINFTDGSGPIGSIFVYGMTQRFPFHPRDHIYWGHTKDLLSLFDISYNNERPDNMNGAIPSNPNYEFINYVRAESYVGMHYYSKFSEKIKEYIKNPSKYINVSEMGPAPNINETWNEYLPIRDRVMKTFPQIRMKWPKYQSNNFEIPNRICSTEFYNGEDLIYGHRGQVVV